RQAAGLPLHGRDGGLGRDLPLRRTGGTRGAHESGRLERTVGRRNGRRGVPTAAADAATATARRFRSDGGGAAARAGRRPHLFQSPREEERASRNAEALVR